MRKLHLRKTAYIGSNKQYSRRELKNIKKRLDFKLAKINYHTEICENNLKNLVENKEKILIELNNLKDHLTKLELIEKDIFELDKKNQKQCRKCFLIKEKIEFYRTFFTCKTCHKIDRNKHYINNKKKVIKAQSNYLKNNINAKLAHNLRIRINIALKNKSKRIGSAVRDLGCTISELKQYLESKFQDSMSWDNYGQWHIDHIKPLSKYNLSNREEFLEACHYTNLQPLWAEDNMRKYNN